MEGILSDWFELKSGVRQGCTIAPSLFLSPMDWILERTVHCELVGASHGDESFEVILLSLEIRPDEASPFGLEFNWGKTKIQTLQFLSMFRSLDIP